LAAIRYLDLLRSHYLVGASWCDLIHAYRLGPTAFKSGERASAYVSDVLAQAQRYSELRTE
ncbi:MAG: hypothetical protein KC422_24915, partial [Trueperaceae bacterium]|nr:hypothetical protein [Trueperaceae bacterium]